MSSMMRRALVRVLIPMSWRWSDERVGRSLERFSAVEADSAWQMLRAMERTEDPAFRARLFNNALEEVHHAAVFRGLARKLPGAWQAGSHEPRRELVAECRGDLKLFEAYHHVGEMDVYSQFYSYAQACGREDVRETFMVVRGDEEEHQKLAYEQLVAMCGSRRAARRMIRGVRLRRAMEAWKRLGAAMGDTIAAVVLSVIYFVVGPVVAPVCRRRMAVDAERGSSGQTTGVVKQTDFAH